MNAPHPPGTKPPPAPPPVAQRPMLTREDAEFLPAALEILETPPSPVRVGLIYFFAALVSVALAWSWFGRLDIIAIGQGKLQPPGRVKVVQSIEAGKVTRFLVTNGQEVKQGDILVELDRTEALADLAVLENLLRSTLAEIERRSIAITRGQTPELGTAGIADALPPDLPADIRLREQRILEADLSQLAANLAALDAQAALKQREKERLADTIAAQVDLVKNLQDRVDMRASLLTSGTGSKASVIDGKETLLSQRTVLASQRGQLREMEASMRVLAAERGRHLQSFLSENTLKRAEASRNLEEINQRIAKARVRLQNLTLRSPTAGEVSALSINSVGQVVGAGHDVMRIVPSGPTLEVEAYFFNKDIGFVRPGQSVTVKVDSFPFSRFGTLAGRVKHVASDAIPLPDAQQIEGNPIRPGETSLFAGAQRTQNLVFAVTIALESADLIVEGRPVRMSPGMTVTAEIRTGSRRVLEYLFSPLTETTAEAMRER